MGKVAFIRPALADILQPEVAMTKPSLPATKWGKTLGMPPSIEMRHPNELLVDDTYQRSIDTDSSQRLIRRIAAGWDWRMCLPLVVSRRDDGFYVIDGQHRLAAAQLRGDIPFLPCCVSNYATIADEAKMFVAMNRTRRPISRLDDFHAAAASGDEEALQIHALIIDAGFRVSRRTGSQSWRPGEVSFTASIQKVLRKHGAKVCSDALTMMFEAFPDEVLNAGSSVFQALTKIALGNDAPDRDRLFLALLTYDQKGWAEHILAVKGGGEDRALFVKGELLRIYQDGL